MALSKCRVVYPDDNEDYIGIHQVDIEEIVLLDEVVYCRYKAYCSVLFFFCFYNK